MIDTEIEGKTERGESVREREREGEIEIKGERRESERIFIKVLKKHLIRQNI